MQLTSFRKLKGWTLQHVADLMGLKTPSSVHRHETGVRFPSPRVIDKYVEITEGAVTYADWSALHTQRNTAPAPMLGGQDAVASKIPAEEPLND